MGCAVYVTDRDEWVRKDVGITGGKHLKFDGRGGHSQINTQVRKSLLSGRCADR